MQKQIFFSLSLIILFLLCTKTESQSPAAAPAKAPSSTPAKAPPTAPAKAPAAKPPAAADTGASANAAAPVMVPAQNTHGAPLNIVKVLQKAGHFAFFVRLIKGTQEDLQFFSQLNHSRDGLTIFAPTDSAFSAIIKAGTLNSLTDQEKRILVQFHVIPKFLSTSQFQTVSNPIRTLAGSGAKFPLNVLTTYSSVNISTGLTNTSVSGIVYTDNKVGIYQVDKVLLPLDIFAPKPPAPAPKPAKPEKTEGAESPVVPKVNTSGVPSGIVHNNLVIIGVGIIAAMVSL